MILGFAGASLFSGSLLVPTKPGPAELIVPKVNQPEKQPEATTATSASRQQSTTTPRDRRSVHSDVSSNRYRKVEPLVVRRIPVNDAIRRRVESEEAKSAEQTRPIRSDQPVKVTDPYDPNCNPDREICAGVKSKSRPRRVEPAPTNAPEESREQKGNSVLNAIKKVIPGKN